MPQNILIIQIIFKNGSIFGKKYVKHLHFKLTNKLKQNFAFKTIFLFLPIEIEHLNILIENIWRLETIKSIAIILLIKSAILQTCNIYI